MKGNEPTAKLDPEWEEVVPGVWTGAGQSVWYRVYTDAGLYSDTPGWKVALLVAGTDTLIESRHAFPSLSSAQRWCEHHFG